MPRTLAHLYHFYLHGERGNRGPGSGSESDGGTKTGNSRAQPAAPKVHATHVWTPCWLCSAAHEEWNGAVRASQL